MNPTHLLEISAAEWTAYIDALADIDDRARAAARERGE